MMNQDSKTYYQYFKDRIKRSGLAELRALEPKVTSAYERGFLTAHHFGRLDVKIMEEIARFECIT